LKKKFKRKNAKKIK